jgi:hypothetical protein
MRVVEEQPEITGLVTGLASSAVLSPCDKYRYQLIRRWQPAHQAGAQISREVLFVMLNPSYADAEHDDRTVGRCIGFSRRWGFGGLRVVNLYAFRSTDPDRLHEVVDPVGPENDAYLRENFAAASRLGLPVIAAWGGGHASPQRVDQVAHLADDAGVVLWALGTTKEGAPRHPSRLRKDPELVRWRR